MATTAQPTTWPEGVIARYQNTVGSDIDITYDHASGVIVADCTGCPWQDHTNTQGLLADTPDEEKARVERYLPASHREAQSHAEKCRGVARPTA
jgi:hypothetical protein